jgi:DNA-binding transcriptional ArsR family regulator
MDMFSALAEPNRRSILETLASNGQLSATAISRKFHVSPPAISQHLKILREAGLVRMEKRAQQHLYSINSDAMHELEGWARRMAEQYERQYDALERLVREEERQASNFGSGKDKRNGKSDGGSHAGNGRKNKPGH